MMIQFFEATIPARDYGGAAKVRVMSPGGTTVLKLVPKYRDEVMVEMKAAQVLKLCEGLLDAATTRGDLNAAKRNAWLRRMTARPLPGD
ncbi:MAG TPA: hypothetical protein PKE55_00815 [Kiritimatiellia bacterium]|nr:hypothetical protein [Kiritimatiellia bacterium]